jgi:hypothetical protein
MQQVEFSKYFVTIIFIFSVAEVKASYLSKLESKPSYLEKEKKYSDFEQNLINKNKAISSWFDNVTEGIDLFLVGEKITNKKNASQITLKNTTISRESDNLTNLTDIAVNPRLHNLEAYWNLKFTTYDNQATTRATEGGYARATPRDQNYGATIGLFKKMQNVRFAFQPRIELQGPIKISHSLSGQSILAVGKLKINPKLEFFANATKGVGTEQALNFNYPLDSSFSITFANKGEYEDKLNKYSVINAIYLGQMISENKALEYGITFFSNNRPNYHLEAYSFSVMWSQEIYRNILDLQAGPHFDFVEDERFKGFIGGHLTLSLHF